MPRRRCEGTTKARATTASCSGGSPVASVDTPMAGSPSAVLSATWPMTSGSRPLPDDRHPRPALPGGGEEPGQDPRASGWGSVRLVHGAAGLDQSGQVGIAPQADRARAQAHARRAASSSSAPERSLRDLGRRRRGWDRRARRRAARRPPPPSRRPRWRRESRRHGPRGRARPRSEPSRRPAATQHRSRAAAPPLRMSRTCGRTAGSRPACLRRRAASYEKPVPINASPSPGPGPRVSGAPFLAAPPPRRRGEGLPAERVVDDADAAPGGVLAGDGDSEDGKAVDEVDRAVEGVDHPGEPGPRPAGASLLGEDAVVRPLVRQPPDDQLLARPVGRSDEICDASTWRRCCR